MWKEVGDYLLKVSLLVLAAWLVYPLAQHKFDPRLGKLGLFVFALCLALGFYFLWKHYQEFRNE